jgi:hypothetical protein
MQRYFLFLFFVFPVFIFSQTEKKYISQSSDKIETTNKSSFSSASDSSHVSNNFIRANDLIFSEIKNTSSSETHQNVFPSPSDDKFRKASDSVSSSPKK